MPKPICFPCQREMVMSSVGVTVMFEARATAGPYQAWQSDIFTCPGCGHMICAGYGTGPTWEHFRGEPVPEHIAATITERPLNDART